MIQLTVWTLSILIVEEVCEAQVLLKDPLEELAIPLESNLDDESDESNMVAALFRNIDVDKALKKTQVADKAWGKICKTWCGSKCHCTEEDSRARCVYWNSPVARERGHMLIAIENPNFELEVKINHRTKGEPIIGSTVRFQVIWPFLDAMYLVHMPPLWMAIRGQPVHIH